LREGFPVICGYTITQSEKAARDAIKIGGNSRITGNEWSGHIQGTKTTIVQGVTAPGLKVCA